MRRILIAVLIACLMVTGTAIQLSAQKYKGEVVINTNSALSLVGSVIRISFKVADFSIEGLDTKVSPALSGTIDVGVTDRISLGVGYFSQVAKAEWTGYTDTILDTVFHGTFGLKVHRKNYGLRALIHFGNNDKIDPYFGFRAGFGQWKLTPSIANIDLFDKLKFKSGVTFQAIFGMRYYFLSFLGVNAELAFGFPYFMSAGLSWKFGGMKYKD